LYRWIRFKIHFFRKDSSEDKTDFSGISKGTKIEGRFTGAMRLLYLSYSHRFLGQPAKRSIFLDETLGNKKED